MIYFTVPWCQSPIPLNEEIIRSAHVLKENVKGDVSIFPEKQYKYKDCLKNNSICVHLLFFWRIEDNCPTEEQIEKANSLYAKAPQHHQKVLRIPIFQFFKHYMQSFEIFFLYIFLFFLIFIIF